jgi:nucleotide-binding universal stress UspA family protein
MLSGAHDEGTTMGYKTILVHLDNGARCPARLDLALGCAQTFDAHLVGLFALSTPRYPSYALAEAGAAVEDAGRRMRVDAARKAEEAFRAAVNRAGRSEVEWRPSEDDALEATRLSARYADLVIVGQYDPDSKRDPGTTPDFAEALVLSAGRPVLMIPYAGKFKTLGKRVLVAWNSSRESARAVHDALPLLQQADAVQVVAFNPRKGAEHGEVPGADIGLTLARHGVRVQVAQQHAEGLDIGSQILSRAADVDADLIVMGAYGHSRMRELVLGGATRTLIQAMTVPVLMSH